MTSSVERLRARAKEDQQCADNSKVIVEALAEQMRLFESREGHNVYAVRMAVDHRNSVKRDSLYAADLLEAAAEIDRLRRELEEARRALENARTQILSAYRIWVADDVAAFPPPKTQAGEVIAQIDAILAAKEQQPSPAPPSPKPEAVSEGGEDE